MESTQEVEEDVRKVSGAGECVCRSIEGDLSGCSGSRMPREACFRRDHQNGRGRGYRLPGGDGVQAGIGTRAGIFRVTFNKTPDMNDEIPLSICL